MTVSTTTIRIVYDGNGSTLPFAVPFEFLDASEIDVKTVVAATGVVTQQNITTNYTVSGGDGAIGTVTFLAGQPPASGTEVHIERVSATTQNVDLSPSQIFPSASVEQAMDRQAMRQQEDRLALERTIRMPKTDQDTDTGYPSLELPSKVDRASKYLSFDSSGNVVTSSAVTPNTVTVSSQGETLVGRTSYALMRTLLDVIENAGNVDKIQIGAESVRAALSPSTFGDGIFITSNENRIWIGDGSTIYEVGISQKANADLPSSGYVAGRMFLDTNTLMLKRDSGSAVVDVAAPWCYGSIGGLRLGGGGSATLSITDGSCRMGTSANPSLMNAVSTTASFTKTLSNSHWAAGSGTHGKPNGVSLTANAWYHVFMIGKNDGTIDFGIDTHDEATTLLNDSNAGAGVNPFRYYRHLGWIKWNAAGNAIVNFTHRSGDDFVWADVTQAYAVQNTNWVTETNLSLVPGCPPNVYADLQATVHSPTQAIGVAFSEKGLTTTAGSFTPVIANPGSTVVVADTIDEASSVRWEQWTGPTTEIAIQHQSGATTNDKDLHISCYGWRDYLRSSPL